MTSASSESARSDLPKPSRLRVLEPETAKLLAWVAYLPAACLVWATTWPESWAKLRLLFDTLAPLATVVFLGFFATLIGEMLLLERFGKLGEDGKVRMTSNPNTERLENIEAAINRLYEYVQTLDPDLDEERELRRKLFEGDGMFAGIDLSELTRDRMMAGKRTLATSIWQDPPEPEIARDEKNAL